MRQLKPLLIFVFPLNRCIDLISVTEYASRLASRRRRVLRIFVRQQAHTAERSQRRVRRSTWLRPTFSAKSSARERSKAERQDGVEPERSEGGERRKE